jgi:TorA maturation chaperone TorD
VTFISTFVDVLNADQHKPGIFEARGHDYSADLGRMTAVAFDLPVTDDQVRRVEVALRDRQLEWAQKREVSQELADAVERIESQLDKWGAEPAAALKEKLQMLSNQAALEIRDTEATDGGSLANEG